MLPPKLPAVPRLRRAFTLVEILVTVGIIAVLASLLVGGLRGAMATARKTKELNALRGIHAAWYQYSSTFEEHILPGFVDTATQEQWQIAAPMMAGAALPRGLLQTYPWRLAPFVDSPFSAYVGYMEFEGSDNAAIEAVAAPWSSADAPPAWAADVIDQRGSRIALQPGFGYNAFYVGGWYEQGGAPKFSSVPSAVATRLAGITRASQQVIFAGATFRGAGRYPIRGSDEDFEPGAAWIAPPTLGTGIVWQPLGMTDTGILEVIAPQGVPARRYNGQVGTVRSDGSTENASIATLLDMRLWTDAAKSADYSHPD
jgi:prepilin-type N-terminal cleavage/methylation domain-containing protein